MGVSDDELAIRAGHRHRPAGRSADASRLGAGRVTTTRRGDRARPVPARAHRAAAGAERRHGAADRRHRQPLRRLCLRAGGGEAGRADQARGQAGLRQGRPPRRRDLGDPSGVQAGAEGGRLGPEQAAGRRDGEDRQQHRRHQDRRGTGRRARNSHEFHRTLHPPAGPRHRGQPDDPAARRAGPHQPAGAPVSQGRRDRRSPSRRPMPAPAPT